MKHIDRHGRPILYYLDGKRVFDGTIGFPDGTPCDGIPTGRGTFNRNPVYIDLSFGINNTAVHMTTEGRIK